MLTRPEAITGPDDLTRLLEAASEGSDEALDQAFAAVYPRLREIAKARRGGWSGAPTLSTTSLVHEAYLKLSRAATPRYESRGHFFATVARAMRQILINHAERRSALKRGGSAPDVTLSETDAISEESIDELLALDLALRRLAELDSRQASVVECLFFGGLTIPETSEALGISRATVKRDWTVARAWLYRELAGEPRAPGGGGDPMG